VCAALLGVTTNSRAQASGPASLPKPASAAKDLQTHIHRIEERAVDATLAENQAPLQLSLAQLMDAYNVPGFSIAVISNYQIAWAKGYGTIAADSKTPVTTATLFQAASISKPVTATAALALIEQGKLSLNEDVNRKLTTWKVPENEFTQQQNVTLRELIAHIGGLNVHGFRGYDENEPRPTLLQVLNGEKPANNPPIRVTFVPGSKEVYSGGGIVVEQQLMMDATGKDFPAIMRTVVLDKLGMTHSTYEQPLPAARATLAARGMYPSGESVHGGWFIYPEQGPAGLWTTPTDLAKFAIETAKSRNGQSNKVLSQAMTTTMLTPWAEGGATCCHMDKLNPGQFSHNGENEGFEGLMTMNWKTGNGLVMMANSNNGEYLWDFVMRSVDKEYGWNYKFAGQPRTLPLVAKIRGVQAALQQFAALKAAGTPEDKVGEGDLNQVGYLLLASGRIQDAITVFLRNVEEYPQSSNTYDSLGEAYMKAGQNVLAVENYQKSLELNPRSDNARAKLKQLAQ
jgi:CubicO group peptidase (beta-lactamase class C family)